jgi:hypothetical protein
MKVHSGRPRGREIPVKFTGFGAHITGSETGKQLFSQIKPAVEAPSASRNRVENGDGNVYYFDSNEP